MNAATTAVVADTHILIWYLLSPGKLSQDATEALEGSVAAEETIRVSAYSMIELVYAVERARNPFTEQDRRDVLDVLATEDSPFEVVPVTEEIANRVASVPRTSNACAMLPLGVHNLAVSWENTDPASRCEVRSSKSANN